MYYYLTRDVKRRIIQELHTLFREYPDLNKMKVTDKFPYDERPQYGVVVKNASGESLPLASDNFMSIVVSHCFTAKLKGKKGLFLDWVKEDEHDVTNKVTEDVSSQIATGNNIFTITDTPTQGRGTVDTANSVRQIHVTVNGSKVTVEAIDGKNIIIGGAVPMPGDVVLITYWKRILAPSGIYYIELTEVNPDGTGQVTVDPLYNKSPTIIERAVGDETNFQLVDFPVFHKTFELIEVTPNQEVVLTPNVHYILDEVTGLITFLPSPENASQTLRYHAKYKCNYKIQGATLGPYNVHRLQSGLGIIPGVTLAFSQWFEKGDKLVVLVTDKREPVSREYGGDFDMSVSMEIYSRDPVQREMIGDLVAMHFWAVLKPKFDGIGLLLKSVSLSGESEDMYDENTDTVYYMAGVDLSITADWRLYLPIVVHLKQILAELDIVVSATDFKLSYVSTGETLL